jgi:hypothetical protein
MPSAITAIHSPFGFDVPSLLISHQRTSIMIFLLWQSALYGLLSKCQIIGQKSTWIISSTTTGIGAWCCKDKRLWLAFVRHSEGGENFGSGQTTSGDDQGGKAKDCRDCPNLLAASVYDTKPVHLLSMAFDCVDWYVTQKKVWNEKAKKKSLVKFLLLNMIDKST